MKTTLFAAAYTGYLLFGLLQIAAAATAIQHVSGFWWLICWLGALLVGWMPVVGTSLGIYGAHVDWQWALPAAMTLFVGVPALLLLLLSVSVWSASADGAPGQALEAHGRQ